MTSRAPRCSAVSAALEEPLFATASTVRCWLLIEQPGAWGPHAVRQSRFPRRVARALLERTRPLGIRIVLIRRPGRTDGSGAGGRSCYAAFSGTERWWLEHEVVSDPRDLLDADLERFATGEPPGLGRIVDESLFLVCTNGRRDPCCAEGGRPVAGALADRFGSRVWECSHIGGDRFAGNLVCLPRGVYFGRLGPVEAVPTATAYDGGVLDLHRYRGRSALGFAEQAAEHFLRVERSIRGLDDVRFVGGREVDGGVVLATFEAGGEAVEVRVRRTTPDPRRLTCHSLGPARPRAYELVEMRPARPAG